MEKYFLHLKMVAISLQLNQSIDQEKTTLAVLLITIRVYFLLGQFDTNQSLKSQIQANYTVLIGSPWSSKRFQLDENTMSS